MPASTKDMIGSIEPGSVPQGNRQALEQGLQQVMGSAAPAVPNGGGLPAVGAGAEDLAPLNPLDPLLSGDIPVDSDPVTSGLSVGPGPKPFVDPFGGDDMISNLRAIALYARSPALRHLARRALRTSVRTKDVG